MISRLNASSVNSLYQEAVKKNEKSTTIAKQGDLGKIERLKADIANGSYRVDIEALAEKIAEELTRY